MNCFIPDKPKVVILKDDTKWPEVEVATNIAPETLVIVCDTKDEFDNESLGLPFNSTQ